LHPGALVGSMAAAWAATSRMYVYDAPGARGEGGVCELGVGPGPLMLNRRGGIRKECPTSRNTQKKSTLQDNHKLNLITLCGQVVGPGESWEQ